jgi:type VI secretion system secreted protein Hcp
VGFQIYATIVGSKQGAFKGEGIGPGKADKIPAVAFSYGVVEPYDAATGRITGRRQHKPVVLTKEWGASSPQFFQAAYTNEVLKSVLIEFYTVERDGKEAVDHTVKLTNATIVSVDDAEEDKTPADTNERERISFVFQKIEIESLSGKTSAMDDWSAQV